MHPCAIQKFFKKNKRLRLVARKSDSSNIKNTALQCFTPRAEAAKNKNIPFVLLYKLCFSAVNYIPVYIMSLQLSFIIIHHSITIYQALNKQMSVFV